MNVSWLNKGDAPNSRHFYFVALSCSWVLFAFHQSGKRLPVISPLVRRCHARPKTHQQQLCMTTHSALSFPHAFAVVAAPAAQARDYRKPAMPLLFQFQNYKTRNGSLNND